MKGRPLPAGRRLEGIDGALEELGRLYARLEEDPRLGVFHCRGDGACCRFGSSGLDLFMTFLEAAFLFGPSAPVSGGIPLPREGNRPAACPFLKEGLCTRRNLRALGCRIYACDPALEKGRAAVNEEFHGALKEIHGRHGIPYDYREIGSWASLFRERGGRPSPSRSLRVDRRRRRW